jgi:hypothetical protein
MLTNIFIARELKTSKKKCSQTWSVKVHITHKTYKLIMMKENQNINIKKFNQKEKDKNKPSKLGAKKPP